LRRLVGAFETKGAWTCVWLGRLDMRMAGALLEIEGGYYLVA